MADKIAYIKTEKRDYPIVFNINVMEEIQEAYGSISAWGEVVDNKDGGEPKVKDLKAGFMAMINEGIDIENEKNGTNEPMLTSKQVGRIISEVGFENAIREIQNLTIASTETGDNEGKNE